MTDTFRTKLGEGGRVIIPAVFRSSLSLLPGDDIILHLSEDTICITTPNQALRKLQAKVKSSISAIGENISLADKLLTIRSSEVSHE